MTALVGLDLSAAFDTVCHDTLLQRLQAEFDVSGTVLSWIQSYLVGRRQVFKLREHQSSEVEVTVSTLHLFDPVTLAFTLFK